MDVAEVVFAEPPLPLGRQGRWLCRSSVEAFGPQDAIDVVAIEMRQEVAKHEGKVIQREARGSPDSADDRALLFGDAPRQLFGPA